MESAESKYLTARNSLEQPLVNENELSPTERIAARSAVSIKVSSENQEVSDTKWEVIAKRKPSKRGAPSSVHK
jgi:hypothetical protein